MRPGEAWKREDVAEVYRETVERYGLPARSARMGRWSCENPWKVWENRGTGR